MNVEAYVLGSKEALPSNPSTSPEPNRKRSFGAHKDLQAFAATESNRFSDAPSNVRISSAQPCSASLRSSCGTVRDTVPSRVAIAIELPIIGQYPESISTLEGSAQISASHL